MNPFKKTIFFLKHWFTSINRHGAHSPFLFSLFQEVFNKPISLDEKNEILALKKQYINNQNTITFEEFGAGNNNGKVLTISSIAKKTSINLTEAKVLINLCKVLNPTEIIELGTSLGISAKALTLGAPNARITTIEGCKEVSEISINYFKNQGNKNVTVINTTFDTYFKSIEQNKSSWDLVYIDGNHTFEATIRYYNLIKSNYSALHTCVIFDDIYWSEGMLKAWNQIINDDENTLTLDLFSMGLVFFNKELSKQHFKIRI
jgi:predicted O-methyltransferase YrrM